MSLPFTVPPFPGVRKTYVDFNGSDERLRSSSAAALGHSDAWSALYVFKPNSGFTGEEMLFQFRGNDDDDNTRITIQGAVTNNPLRVQLWNSTGTQFKTLDWVSLFTAGVGAHLVITFDGATAGDPVTVYKNGVDQGAGSGTNNTGTMGTKSRLVAVASNTADSPGAVLNAHWQELAVWSSVLTAAEVATLWANRRYASLRNNFGGYVSSANLTHWWKPDNSSDIGADYGYGTAIDIDGSAANVSSADVFLGHVI